MELGPIQKAWVKSLRKNHHRQYSSALGEKNEDNDDYQACCLGEYLCVAHKLQDKPAPFLNGMIVDGKIFKDDNEFALQESYTELGLANPAGTITHTPESRDYICQSLQISDYPGSLAEANDDYLTWPQIADFVEKYPETVFTKSV